MLKAHNFVRPSNGEPPKRVCFIQCVGSRDRQIGNEYCSKVCCGIASKEAIEIRQQVPDCKVFIFYIDMRMYGYWENQIYWPAQEEYHVSYISGIVTEVIRRATRLVIRGEDTTMGRPMEVPMDVVILSVGMEPSAGHPRDGEAVRAAAQNKYGFIETVAPRARPPSTTSRAGIFVAGAAARPCDLEDTVSTAGAAAPRRSPTCARRRRARHRLTMLHDELPFDEVVDSEAALEFMKETTEARLRDRARGRRRPAGGEERRLRGAARRRAPGRARRGDPRPPAGRAFSAGAARRGGSCAPTRCRRCGPPSASCSTRAAPPGERLQRFAGELRGVDAGAATALGSELLHFTDPDPLLAVDSLAVDAGEAHRARCRWCCTTTPTSTARARRDLREHGRRHGARRRPPATRRASRGRDGGLFGTDVFLLPSTPSICIRCSACA